ncbi:hypothetical protein QJS10_CPB18g00024 [Acorus calamus]|uniref:Uncharacterized protein n=1 Tax=Acorus calamus TaxID=4465 RepID=A0AAV9CR23_ACOCL|nr:hypothetical protein QJS10_CPB18g00024 [Acorus calamus]
MDKYHSEYFDNSGFKTLKLGKARFCFENIFIASRSSSKPSDFSGNGRVGLNAFTSDRGALAVMREPAFPAPELTETGNPLSLRDNDTLDRIENARSVTELFQRNRGSPVIS